jgi:dimethylhistidine N-methyltransferase
VSVDTLIREGLSRPQKQLPSLLLYDEVGSRLFEVITRLPEYGVAAAGLRLVEAHRHEVIAGDGPWEIVELGPGAGRKARLFVEALRERQRRVRFFAVDVSQQALIDTRRTLRDLDGVQVECIEDQYLEGLQRAVTVRDAGARQLVLFLGSNLSNFERHEALDFLRGVRARLRPKDALLLATDLDKEPERLLPAYDDVLGVTSAFNRNVLMRLNREWAADFPLSAFSHQARWNAAQRRIEMHLQARRACEVHVRKLNLATRFAAGETVWTESSHRFSIVELRSWAERTGFGVAEQWVDAEWPFAQTLLVAV